MPIDFRQLYHHSIIIESKTSDTQILNWGVEKPDGKYSMDTEYYEKPIWQDDSKWKTELRYTILGHLSLSIIKHWVKTSKKSTSPYENVDVKSFDPMLYNR